MKILNFVKTKLIPFDGSWSSIGGLLLLLPQVGIDPMAVVSYVSANPTVSGFAMLGLGLIGKYVKYKSPETPEFH
jgi:hypothetical protein